MEGVKKKKKKKVQKIMNKILLAYFKRRRWEFYWRLKLNRSNASNPATYTEPYQPDSTQNRRRFAKLSLSLSLLYARRRRRPNPNPRELHSHGSTNLSKRQRQSSFVQPLSRPPNPNPKYLQTSHVAGVPLPGRVRCPTPFLG